MDKQYEIQQEWPQVPCFSFVRFSFERATSQPATSAWLDPSIARAYIPRTRMPLTKSATKRMRQSALRHARLLPYKTSMKTTMRKLSDAVKAGKKDDAKIMLPMVYRAIDTAAKKRIIHPRNAARKKARMAKLAA